MVMVVVVGSAVVVAVAGVVAAVVVVAAAVADVVAVAAVVVVVRALVALEVVVELVVEEKGRMPTGSGPPGLAKKTRLLKTREHEEDCTVEAISTYAGRGAWGGGRGEGKRACKCKNKQSPMV